MLLWENTGTTLADTTIALDLSEYDGVLVKCAQTAYFTTDSTFYIAKGAGTKVMGLGTMTTTAYNRTTRWASITASGVQFSIGVYIYPSAFQNSAGVCVPMKIYGVKGVIN